MKEIIIAFVITAIGITAACSVCAAPMTRESQLGPSMTEFNNPEQRQSQTDPLFKKSSDGGSGLGDMLDNVFNKAIPDTVNTVGKVLPGGGAQSKKTPE